MTFVELDGLAAREVDRLTERGLVVLPDLDGRGGVGLRADPLPATDAEEVHRDPVVGAEARAAPADEGLVADADHEVDDEGGAFAGDHGGRGGRGFLIYVPLYAGGGVKASVRSSQLVRESAVLDLQATINDALLVVRTNYYGVLLAREKITVQEKNLELLQEQLKTATDRFNAGTISSFERLRAEVAVANAKFPLITARNDFRLAVESLRQSLGFTTNLPDQIDKLPVFLGTLEFSPTTFDLIAALEASRAKRPELQRLAKLAASREQTVTVAGANALPNVSAFGGWELRKGSGGAFRESHDGWRIGVQSQWNIFDGRATAGRVAQARSVLEQTKLSLAEFQLASDVEVRRAFSQWQQAVELADASKKVVAQADEAVRLATARYNAGTATQLDVLSAQVDLTTARTNQLQAFYTYNVAVASLRKAMGQSEEFVTTP